MSSNNESGQGSDPTLGVAFFAFVDARNKKIFGGGGGGGLQILTRGSPTNFTISKTHILESRWGGGGVRTPVPLWIRQCCLIFSSSFSRKGRGATALLLKCQCCGINLNSTLL